MDFSPLIVIKMYNILLLIEWILNAAAVQIEIGVRATKKGEDH